MPLCKTCKNKIPSSIKISGVTKSLSGRTNCPDCVPIGTRPNSYITSISTDGAKKCNSCGIVKPLDSFYIQNDRKAGFHECKNCLKERQKRRVEAHKRRAIDFLGGKCVKCGYSECLAALDFHHLDPNTKEFNLNCGRRSWSDIEQELKKCVLLCANCHRKEHTSSTYGWWSDTPRATS